MADQNVEEIYSSDEKRRVTIWRRDAGTFYYEPQHWSDAEYEHCWIPYGPTTAGFYDSQATAVREAQGNVDWLVLQRAEEQP